MVLSKKYEIIKDSLPDLMFAFMAASVLTMYKDEIRKLIKQDTETTAKKKNEYNTKAKLVAKYL